MIQKNREYGIFTTPVEIRNMLNQALHHLPELGFDIQLTFERIGAGTFQDTIIGAVSRVREHKMIVNLDWYETTDEQDLKYLIWHEVRHLYQWSQIEKLEHGYKLSENEKKVAKWKYEMCNYISNTPKTELAHMKQDIEIDAYAFAMFMLFLYCSEDGSVNIGLPPMIEDEIIKRVEDMSTRLYL